MSELPEIITNNYNGTHAGNYSLKNNGHSVVVSPSLVNASLMPTIQYGDDTYQLYQFHFHWGRNDSQGSEHTIDGKKYPAEVHFVHLNKKYNASDAINHADGILVWGFLIDVQAADNADFQKIVAEVPNVLYKDQTKVITYFDVESLLPNEKKGYFTYNGSLTTPECQESVTWIVSQTPIKMSSAQIAEFRKMYSGVNSSSAMLLDTFRPPQPIKGRKVYSNVDVDKSHNFLMATGWTYSTSMSDVLGVMNWANNYPYCDDSNPGSRQSPININTNTVEYDDQLPTLELIDYEREDATAKYNIVNDGHTIKVDIPSTINVTATYNSNTYKLMQFHFHWGNGSSNRGGSEHLIDDKRSPAEVHFVHYNTKYESIGKAVAESDGLLVQGFFIEANDSKVINQADQDKLFNKFSDVKNKGQSSEFAYFPVGKLLPHNATEHFYTYEGSLTVPACFKSVKWIVNRKTIYVTEAQLSKFSGIYKNKASEAQKQLIDTYRNAMKLHSRVVKSNFKTASHSATTTESPSSAVTTIATLGFIFGAVLFSMAI